MSELRQSLRVYAHLKYMEYIQPLLKEHGFVRPSDSQICVTMEDVCKMINETPGLSYDKSDQLFEIFHYKVSAWTSNVVDAWAEINEIVIKMPKRVASLQRQPNNDFYRGSFGPIVNSARMESVKKIMRNMYSGQGWKITIAKNQQAASNDLYTSKTWVKNRYQKYIIVEKSFFGCR